MARQPAAGSGSRQRQEYGIGASAMQAARGQRSFVVHLAFMGSTRPLSSHYRRDEWIQFETLLAGLHFTAYVVRGWEGWPFTGRPLRATLA